jgi:hypothetical protein
MNKYGILSLKTYNGKKEEQQDKETEFYNLNDVIKQLETDNYYHSIIRKDDIINFLFDVDGLNEEENDLSELLSDLKKFLKKELKINTKDLIISFSQNEGFKKLGSSYHITIVNLNSTSKNLHTLFTNFKNSLDYLKNAKDEEGRKKNIIDLGIYNKRRVFRCIGQTKGGTNKSDNNKHIIIQGNPKDFIPHYIPKESLNIDKLITEKWGFFKENNEIDIKEKKVKKVVKKEIEKIEDIKEDDKEDIKEEIKNEIEDVKNIDEMDKLISCLSKDRSDDYNEWLSVGFSLEANDKIQGFKKWKIFSKKSSKYNKDDWDMGGLNYNKYLSFKGGKAINLHIWARQDNPELYKKYFGDGSYDKIKKLFETNNFKLRNPLSYVEINNNGELIFRSKQDFLNTYENLFYCDTVGDKSGNIVVKKMNFVKKWLVDEEIRTYNKIDFCPKMTISDEIYNTFDGFEIEKNNKYTFEEKITEEEKEIFLKSKVKNHIDVLCKNDEKVIKYFLNYLGSIVQKPYKKTNTAIVLHSQEGVGKDTFIDHIGTKIIGKKYYYNVVDPEYIYGKFNDDIANKIIIVLNESDYKTNEEYMNKIKGNITAETNQINPKGTKKYEQKNCIKYFYFSNNKNAVKIDPTDRRYQAIECENKYAKNMEYLNPLFEEMKNNKMNLIYYKYLMSLDIDGYDFTNERVITDYYKDIKEIQTNPNILFIENFLLSYDEENITILSNELYLLYSSYCNNNGYIKYKQSNKMFSLDIKNYLGIEKKHTRTGEKYILQKEIILNEFIKKGFIREYDE